MNKEDNIKFDDLDLDFEDLESLGLIDDSEFPELELETDNILMNLSIKKDYSKIKDKSERKKEFIKENQHICLASKGIEQGSCLFVEEILKKGVKGIFIPYFFFSLKALQLAHQ